MTAVRIHYRDDGTAGVRFAYDPQLVDLIKSTVDRIDREYDPDTKTWTIHDAEAIATLLDALRRAGHSVRATGTPSEERRPPPRQPCSASVSTWADTTFTAVGPSRCKAVFRALANVLHPDRPDTGSRELFEQLDAARRKATQ